MLSWPKNPRIYEIDTMAWLDRLARVHDRDTTLDSVPGSEWNAIAEMGMDAVWLMGVWRRSPAGRAKALEDPVMLAEMRSVSPGFSVEDVLGSPYCIQSYEVDDRLGGAAALAQARKELAKRGLLLVLDFVPNHTAMDHPWVRLHPEYYVRGTRDDLAENPGLFVELDNGIFALGKDPYFPAWTDVLQLNAFGKDLRRALASTLEEISGMCDGIRCDMAMLVMNDVFERTWGEHAGEPPQEEFWQEILPAARKRRPDALLMAEAYWDLEWSLMQQGFDCCYDKRLYERLTRGNAHAVRLHLAAEVSFQERLVRFLENHDEQRSACVMGRDRLKAANVAFLTLPGIKLFLDGQFDGMRVRFPPQLVHRPAEEPDREVRGFFARLLAVTRANVFSEGRWTLDEVTGWPDNTTCSNVLAWSWMLGDQRRLIVVNLSENPAQAMVEIPELGLAGAWWRIHDLLTGQVHHSRHDGSDLHGKGLYVDLGPWGCHILGFDPA